MFKIDCAVEGVATLNCLPNLFSSIINWLLAFSGTAAVFFFIFSGIRIMTSGGDAKVLDEARKGLAFSILGLILVLLSFFIVNLTATITNLECIKQFGFTNCLQKIVPINQPQKEQRISPRNRQLQNE